jgi:type II secretory pathway pseudopilin PulG
MTPRRQSEAGFTLIEVLAVGAIALLILGAFVAPQLKYNSDRTTAAVAATQLGCVDTTIDSFISSTFGTLLMQTVTAPVTVPSTAYTLPVNCPATNVYGQSYVLSVQQPAVGTLQWVVYTTGGNATPEGSLALVAAQELTASGFNHAGYILSRAPTTIFGAGLPPGWQLPTSTFPGAALTGGHLVATNVVVGATPLNDALIRNPNGVPGTNQMNQPIDMNNFALQNVQQVNLAPTAIIGQACKPVGALAVQNQAPNPNQGLLAICLNLGNGPIWSDPGPVTFF